MHRRALTAAALAALAATAALAHDAASHRHAQARSMPALEKLSGAAFDRAWLSQMIAHHEVAVIVATMELAHGKRAGIRADAKAVVTAQVNEMAQMHAWLKAWYRVDAEPAQLALMMEDLDPMLAEMKVSAHHHADAGYVNKMIPHHDGAVAMANLALRKAARPELKAFARRVIADQGAQMVRYEKWLEAFER